MKNNTNKKRRHRCSEGASCPFRNEYQHKLEYYHDDDNERSSSSSKDSSSKVATVSFSGNGYSLGTFHNSIPREMTQKHLSSRSKRKHGPTHDTTGTETNDKAKRSKISVIDLNGGNSKMGISSSSSSSTMNHDVIDLCGIDEDDGEIQVLEKHQVASILHSNPTDSQNDEVLLQKTIAPALNVNNSTFSSYVQRNQHQDLHQLQQEQVQLERVISESKRDHIIKCQNSEYEESLWNDREKAVRKKNRLEFLKNRFETEEMDQNYTTIAFRIPPNGKRLLKRFPKNATAQDLYWYVEWIKINPKTNYDIPDSFMLKQVYGGSEIPRNDTLSSLGLDVNGVVIVGEVF